MDHPNSRPYGNSNGSSSKAMTAMALLRATHLLATSAMGVGKFISIIND
jgi:hypothetical protein